MLYFKHILLHVSSKLVAILREVHYKIYITNFLTNAQMQDTVLKYVV
jgi:hypothetical protein